MALADFDGADEIRRAWLAGLAPDPRLTVSEWADRHRILSSRAASEAGPYRTARTPFMRAIMDDLSPSSPAQRVVFMKAAQVGATEAGNNWIGFCMHRAPGPFLAVQPTVDLAMRHIRDLDDWQNAELVRKRTEACLVGIVFGAEDSEQGIAPAVEDADGNRIEQFEPGLIAYARNGKDIKFNQPAATSGIGEWLRAQQHLISAGFRVPYALMTGDMSQANFSSTRAGLNEFRRMIEQVQWQTVIPMFCERIWDWFVEYARIEGLLPMDGEIIAEWGTPRFESVNPLQDAQADLLEVRSGFSTIPQQIARRGYDPDEILEEAAEFNAKMDGLGVVFDADPRKVTKAGLVQTTDPNAAPAREAETE